MISSNKDIDMVKVRIPAVFKESAGGRRIIEALPGTIEDIIRHITGMYPELEDNIYDKNGSIRSNIHILLNGEIIDNSGIDRTAASEEDSLVIVAAFSSG